VFVIFDKHENNRVVAVSDDSRLVNTYNALCQKHHRRYGYRIVNDFTRDMRKRGRVR
jgi:hypothetical protein